MRIILSGIIINIILDPIFIFGFKLGIQGAAIATLLSICVSSFMIARRYIFRITPIRLKLKDFKLNIFILIGIIGIGMAAFVMNITTGMVNIIMNRYLVHNGGDFAIGAYGIISCYSILISMLMMGICQGMQPIISYNYGAKKWDRIKEALRTSVRIGTIIAITGFIFIETLAPWLVRVFTPDPILRKLSAEGLRITFFMVPLVGYQIIVTSFFQSIRKAPQAIVMNISRQFVFLVPILSLFSRLWGLTGIWIAIPVTDLLATLVAFLFLKYEKKQHTLPSESS